MGLTGIEFKNMKGDLINKESNKSKSALPKDLSNNIYSFLF